MTPSKTGAFGPNKTFVELAKQLRNPRIDRVIEGYREWHLSVLRAGFAGVLWLWAAFWAWGAPERPKELANLKVGQVLQLEAAQVFPWISAGFLVALFFAWGIRRKWIPEKSWVDVLGTTANYVGIFILLKLAFNLMIASVTFLPLVTISVGARYGRRAFFASMLISTIIVGFGAPPNYWVARPAFAIFALALLIGVPLTVQRLLNALYEVSMNAVRSRDAQARFVSMLSHELRTPLNSVVHAASLIDSESLPIKDAELLQSLGSNALVLQQRINQVLDVAAIESGRFTLNREDFRVKNIVASVLDVTRSDAFDKDIELESTIAGNDLVLVGDAGRIEQVVSNLVGNAIKYSPARSKVEINISAYQSRHTGRIFLSCEVADRGPGISDANKKRIFEPFFQISAGSSRVYEGIGLGLHIVRLISEAMNGVLTVRDRAPNGTVFHWQVELGLSTNKDVHEEPVPQVQLLGEHRTHVPSLRCLVIDDNTSNRDIIKRMLEMAGHLSVLARSGSEALTILADQTFDIVFLDLHMPGMSGWDLLEIMHQEGARAPVVMLSADSTPENVEIAKRHGAIAYLTKPIAIAPLLEILSKVAEHRKDAALDFSDVDFNTAGPGLPADIDQLLQTREDKRRFYMVTLSDIGTAHEGFAAAFEQGDIERAARLLHDLKGCIGIVAGEKSRALCDALKRDLLAGNDATENVAALSSMVQDVREEIHRQITFLRARPAGPQVEVSVARRP